MTDTDTRIAYTIMPDYGGAYCWMNREWEATKPDVGGSNADTTCWAGDHTISDALHQAFARWQGPFESAAWDDPDYENFDWAAFHATGLALAVRLKAELGAAARVFYCKPFEDPSFEGSHAWEIMGNGEAVERWFNKT